MKTREVKSYKVAQLDGLPRAPQHVHLGRTMLGRPGFFTGHTMAWPITSTEFKTYSTNPFLARDHCTRMSCILDD